MKRFSARPTHPLTGRRIRLHASTQRELDAYLHRLDVLRTELKLDERSPEQVDRAMRRMQHGAVTLEKAALAYAQRAGLAPSTRGAVRALIAGRLAPLARLPLDALDAPRISEWIDDQLRTLEPPSVDTLWRRLRAIVRYASERGWIGGAPWGLYRPKLRRRPRGQREAARTVAEFVRILYAARDLDAAAHFDGRDVGDREAMLACAGLLCLRQGEIAGLRWTDIEPGPPVTVLIARQWAGAPLKGNATPTRIETIPELLEILLAYRARLHAAELYDPCGPVFPWRKSKRGRPLPYPRGEPLTRRNVRAAVAHAGLPNVAAWSAHSLRDTFVTLEAGATGGDLPRIAARSRHASLSSLARYLRQLSRHHPSAPAILKLPGRSLAYAEGPPLLNEPTPPKETPR